MNFDITDRFEVDPVHEADDHAQQRWNEFLIVLKEFKAAHGWGGTLLCVADAYDGYIAELDTFAMAVVDFATEFGWPSTVRAISRAMQESEREQVNAEVE